MTMTVESLGLDFLKRLIGEERKRLEDLDYRIRELQHLQSARRDCAASLHEYEVLLAEYEAEHGSTWYTTPRFENELPLRTYVKIVSHNGHKPVYAEGSTGRVVGYRFAPGTPFPTGWHYIRFDDDQKEYYAPDETRPYVHRQYLEVIP